MSEPSARDQRGFTLIELLVSLLAGLVLLGGTLTVVLAAVRAEATNSNRGVKVEQLDVVVERFTREVRQAQSIAYVSGSGGRAIVLQPGTVTWDCRFVGVTACGRSAGGTTQILIHRIEPPVSNIFTLGCRSSAGNSDGGAILPIPTSGTLPSSCGTNPPSHVDLDLGSRVECGGEGRTTCLDRAIEFRGGVSLRNAG